MKGTFICPPLKDYQKDLFDAIISAGPTAGYIFVVKAMRQVGKSFLVNLILIYHAITYPSSNSICLSITYRNVQKMFEELRNGLDGFPLIDKVDNQAMTIKFKNKSSITFLSAASRENLRGYTVKHNGILIIDEAAYLPEDIFGIVFPYVNAFNANILMVSTPRLRQGSYYEYYTAGFDDNIPNVKSFNWSSYDVSDLLTPERIEMYRKILPKTQFISEVMGDFVDDIAGCFDLKDVFYDDVPDYTDLFIGIDWGSGKSQDYTVISGFDSKANQVMLEYFNNIEPEEQLIRISNILNSISLTKKIRSIKCENNSIGSIYISRLRSLCPNLDIEDFVTTNSSKREIIEYMISRCGQKTIRLIDDNEQYRQFSAYQMEITKAGNITYNGAVGTHDDMVMASAIALSGIKQLETNGNYSLSFKSNPKKSKYRYKY